MKIKWLGHACFLITTDSGIRIVTDPFDETVGYPVPDVEADIVTSSHDHFDHNHVQPLRGNFQLINGVGSHYVSDVPITGIKTYHDEVMGKKRGENVVYVFEADGMRLCHLGDLGHLLDDKTVGEIGPVDILFIPVGGTYTIDAEEAVKVAAQLNPRLIIPMHYKTPVIDFPITGVDLFLAKMGAGERVGSNEFTVNRQDLAGGTQVKVLDYE
jgi:L-ascorbate metabolism protein UlaG (beta-lactamase superfamily)